MASPRIATPLRSVETDRLALTRPRSQDARGLAPVFAQPAVWEFPYGHGMDARWTAGFVDRAIGHWEQHDFGLWIVRLLPGEQTIGYLGLSMPPFLSEIVAPERMPAVEVGWRLHPGHWGMGYATEGARAALREAFETLALGEICSAPQSANPRSACVAERIGMRRERTVGLAGTDARPAVDVDLYWITAERWRASPRDDIAASSNAPTPSRAPTSAAT